MPSVDMGHGPRHNSDGTKTPLSVLAEHWGFQAFRHPQESVISTVLAGQDALVVMATGGGKSLCYQVNLCSPVHQLQKCCDVLLQLLYLHPAPVGHTFNLLELTARHQPTHKSSRSGIPYGQTSTLARRYHL